MVLLRVVRRVRMELNLLSSTFQKRGRLQTIVPPTLTKPPFVTTALKIKINIISF